MLMVHRLTNRMSNKWGNFPFKFKHGFGINNNRENLCILLLKSVNTSIKAFNLIQFLVY